GASVYVKPITGWQSWMRGALSHNLWRTAKYAFEPIPKVSAEAGLSIAERVVAATGPFAAIWTDVCTRFPDMVRKHPRILRTPCPPRSCHHCGGPVPMPSRRDRE